jgi:hypothetical protein
MKATYNKVSNILMIKFLIFKWTIPCTSSCAWNDGARLKRGVDFEIETLEEAHYPNRLMAYPLNQNI